MPIWKQATDLATINGWSARTLMQAIDIRITEIGDDFLRGTMPVDHRTHQPYGILHGGASVALAETLGSSAAMLCCEEGFAAVGLEINANHVRAVRGGLVTGTARPVHIGRSTQVWEIRIENDAGELVCVARLTVAVVPQRAVAPRQEGRKARPRSLTLDGGLNRGCRTDGRGCRRSCKVGEVFPATLPHLASCGDVQTAGALSISESRMGSMATLLF